MTLHLVSAMLHRQSFIGSFEIYEHSKKANITVFLDKQTQVSGFEICELFNLEVCCEISLETWR